jgi:hydroxypyruvate reductase
MPSQRGETTVKLKGSGLGGRNQEFALSLVKRAAKLPGALFLSAGTDGTDGPTDAAGAVVDTDSLSRASSAYLDPDTFLENNDSYHFFQKLGDLITLRRYLWHTRISSMHLFLCDR